MATIDDVLKDVTDETSLIDSIGAIITALQQQVADLLAGTSLPPSVQAKVDQVFATAESNKAKLAAAAVANTAAAGAPTT